MVGTLDYNKVPVIKEFLVFLFPANVKISKNCSRSVQYRWYKDQQKFYPEIYTYLGNVLHLSVTLPVEQYVKGISMSSAERWKKTIHFTSNCQPLRLRGSPFVTINLLSSLHRKTYFMSYRSRLRNGLVYLRFNLPNWQGLELVYSVVVEALI